MSSETKMSDADGNALPMSDIENPMDTDVLCGRGGAALRHPGNQTYRRLVHLNKGLYITCLKAEKLKISRSIVAAIREQNGRFLERDTKKGTWYDIGDKKAMEKTSQALREGQPKLRQKIVELGGGAAGAAALLESQFPGGSMYQIGQQQAQAHAHQQQHLQQQRMQMGQPMFDGTGEMPPPPSRDMQQPHEMLPHSVSLTETTIQEEPGMPNNMQHHAGGDVGIDHYSNLSLLSDFSNYGMDATEAGRSQFSIPSAPHHLNTPGSMASASESSRKHNMDRRKYFARMKGSRPNSGRFSHGSGSTKQLYASNRSLGDGMPDIHLVESNPSLYSNVSGQSAEHKVPDHVANIFESRRSLMSGLSRISDTSDVNSIFSDLSKKIGNVSTRSIAMSEISNMDDIDPESIPSAQMDDF